ncbi:MULTISPECIES: DUF7010 family protein [Terrisporobacter]|uniref:Uncharacterized protein n=2 Tax=Terrisporobacter TaxID=1505652 RepID=A0AAX2ZEP0_9FIRM|nr:hypothetical protein [Terrisporobacter hibernicus]UEL47748.1 hypothetical protein JW646_19375 [Terrisporobacter hibernicus]
MNLEELRLDCAIKQKRGLHIIMSTVIIWGAILLVHMSSMNIFTKNLFTFICTAPLLPISYAISKVIKVDFQNKDNPLTSLGVLFSVNQIVYLLIPMWIYPTIPDKMLMVIAIIAGAHLMPFGWLYKSKTYLVLSVIIPIAALIVGLNFTPVILATMMILFEIIFCICLNFENKNLKIKDNLVV